MPGPGTAHTKVGNDRREASAGCRRSVGRLSGDAVPLAFRVRKQQDWQTYRMVTNRRTILGTVTVFRLRVLGGFALEGDGGVPVSALPPRRSMAVLAVLAVAGDLGCTRERLLALLWPESDEAHARHGLRDALHGARHALTPASIRSTGSLLRLDSAVVDCDVQAFTRAVAAGRLADAVRACGGPLLEGFHLDGAPEFEYWLSAERARLERECVEAVEGLATSAESTGGWAEAVRWWGRAVEHDPVNSHFVLRWLDAMFAIGDRANAIRAGELHVERLREEFGLEPDPSVIDRIERIRGGELPAARGRAATATASPLVDEVPTGPASREPPGGDRRQAAAPPVSARAWHWPAWVVGAAAVVALAAMVQTAFWPSTRGAEVRPPRSAIAVLPFQNLSPDTSRAYLAIGLHEELLARLAQVAALRVVASGSVSGYQQTHEPLDRIGRELSVGSILQASVQVLGNRLRVIAQLVDPATGTALWAETYDRSLDDAFFVQSDIAQQIVSAVGVTLSRAERGGIEASPTANAEAYLLYLQGLDYARRPGDLPENLAIAERLYEGALRLDSTFAVAHAALSMVHWRLYSRRYDESPARAERQLSEARAALRFAPDLPDARVAMAMTYCCGRTSDRQMLQEYTAAARSAPNDAELWAAISLVQARLGNWDSVDVTFERARRLDPRNANLFLAQGNRLHCRRRYAEAIGMYRRALTLAPDYLQPHISLAWSYILWQGELDTLRAVLRGLPDAEPGGGAPRVGVGQMIVLSLERRPDSILTLLRGLRGDVWNSGESVEWRALTAGAAHLDLGDTAAAHAEFASAAVLLDSAVQARPGDPRLHGTRGVVMALLGRRVEAHRELRWLEQSDGYRNNHNCPGEPEVRAIILGNLGETDSALAAVERLLAGNSRVSSQTLRLDPAWDPLRHDPRFQALLARYANPLPATPH